jgi:hypothetical protein
MLWPQLGTSVIDDTVTFRLASGPFERLVSVNDAGAPVWPTANELGKFGATPKATPADAGETTPKRTAPHTSAATSTDGRSTRVRGVRIHAAGSVAFR